jgi:YgiT-type zinc finger domain-containing protein
VCEGTLQEGFSTFAADMGGCIVVIKNVPSRVCGQCGEPNGIIRRLEQIVQNIIASTTIEIAVLGYSKKPPDFFYLWRSPMKDTRSRKRRMKMKKILL